MRLNTLVEQMATFGSGVFTLGDGVVGRREWGSTVARVTYRAESADNPAIWQLGVGDYDGSGVLTPVATIASNGALADGEYRVAQVMTGAMLVVVDSSSADDFRLSPIAVGGGAMAMGLGAEAYGEFAMAIGNAEAGSSGEPLTEAMAIGNDAVASHYSAVALGPGARTFMPGAIQGTGSVLWSAMQNFTGDDTPLLLMNPAGMPTLPVDSAMVVHAHVVARRDDAAGYYAAEIKALVRRGSSGAAVIVGTPVIADIAESAGVTNSVALAVDGVDGAFGIECTGAASQSWIWSAVILGAVA